MFKNLIKRVLPKKRAAGKVHCVRHAVKLAVRNQAALRVLESLHRAGFEAYLVGGAVRDLLLGIEPKDFDVATSATPEQVHRLFRRSRIIGRRFQIVHVMQGSETIEVSTFRSGGRVMQNASGRIMRDNAYGSLEQDAMRRDFTCNALYYDVAAQQVLDFHGGWEDVAARRLVMIGDAAERYQEDPVRMLRAARLSGKLGFAVEAATAAPIGEMGLLLRHEPVARLFDELLKILLSGNAAGCLAALRRLGLTEAVHPLLSAMLRAADGGAQHVGLLALQQTDARLGAGKSVSVGFMLAALFWQDVDGRWHAEMGCGTGAAAAMGAAVNGLRDDMEPVSYTHLRAHET
ncbi:polynucleotide adenylyltransferase PcnB, partial [uncultured Kingella sp.]|uniref:polynucleotide adenylyltransferase PcnB n=1 Tax=uncultured Kingella sp. TaxID=159270 RepID=UPI00259204F6